MMGNAKCLEEGIEFLVFPSPIGLDSNDLTVKLSFNECLKVLKNLEHVRSFLKKIDLGELAIVINKTNIVCVSPNRARGKTPNIGKY